MRSTVEVDEPKVKMQEFDCEATHPGFAWLPVDIIKKTFRAIMQYAQLPMSNATNHLPWIHLFHTPPIDSGAPSAQIFVGTEFAHQYLQNEEGQRDKQFINTKQPNSALCCDW